MNYRVIWIPSVLTVFALRTFTCVVKVVVIFYRLNKTRFVSFGVYRRQSRDRFRININIHWCYIIFDSCLVQVITITVLLFTAGANDNDKNTPKIGPNNIPSFWTIDGIRQAYRENRERTFDQKQEKKRRPFIRTGVIKRLFRSVAFLECLNHWLSLVMFISITPLQHLLGVTF